VQLCMWWPGNTVELRIAHQEARRFKDAAMRLG
jgi:hypothetical protein